MLLATAWGQQDQLPKAPAAVPAPVRKPRAVQPPFNLNVIFLDAAHGGTDDGARLGPNSLEKDATLAFANRLRTLLAADGFSVITTREIMPLETGSAAAPPATAAPTAPAAPTPDQRVEIANRSRALACVLIHATAAGHGVHLYTSALTPPAYAAIEQDLPRNIVPWDTAQAPSVPQSLRLASDLAAAINGIRVPLVEGRVSVKPIDSMTCPTVAIELAPLGTGESQLPASDPSYEARIARAVEAGLKAWRGQAEAQLAAAQAAADAAKPAAPKTPPPAKPKPKVIPEEVPDVLTPAPLAAPKKPAPIIRKDPDAEPAPGKTPPDGGAR